jgi:hypothetical protein
MSNNITDYRVVCRCGDARPARTFFKLPEGFRPVLPLLLLQFHIDMGLINPPSPRWGGGKKLRFFDFGKSNWSVCRCCAPPAQSKNHSMKNKILFSVSFQYLFHHIHRISDHTTRPPLHHVCRFLVRVLLDMQRRQTSTRNLPSASSHLSENRVSSIFYLPLPFRLIRERVPKSASIIL